MFGRETRMLLRHYLEQGSTKSALARQLGVSRDTIHRWIRDGDLDRDVDAEAVRYGPRRRRRPSSMPTSQLSRRGSPRIRSCHHYGCSTRSAPPGTRAATRSSRPTCVGCGRCQHRSRSFGSRRRRVDRRKSTSRDFGLTGACATPCSWYSATRGYCGAASTRARTWRLWSMVSKRPFGFGGVPQELLFDQMRSVITRDLRLEGGALVRNAEFLRFAHHWGFTPRACRPYRAQTKGKVERAERDATTRSRS